ncbi:MAG: electron transfer flavoprotein subunit alpha/FixB family protein [Desulfohalobiaceae bacterium]
MHSDRNVMVFVEQHEDRVADVSRELLCKARELADQLGGEVQAAALGGSGLKQELPELGSYGCSKVFYMQDQRLASYTSVPYAKGLSRILQEQSPRFLLFGASTLGRDLAPRVASHLRCGLTADCTDLQIGEHKAKGTVYQDILLQIRPAFGGNIIATIISPQSSPSMATVREGVMKKRRLQGDPQAEVIEVPSNIGDEDVLTQILAVQKVQKAVDLKAAKIIVSAGMGACSQESLELVRELARILGGAVGGSRPVVDGGYLGKEHQVGQTGTTVRPNLYIACGISGQIQHRAGITEAHRIIAINKDPQAPIFECAHYAIVGDVNQVLPRMIKAYKEI